MGNITYAYVFERRTFERNIRRAGEGCNGLPVAVVATTFYLLKKMQVNKQIFEPRENFHEKKLNGIFYIFTFEHWLEQTI